MTKIICTIIFLHLISCTAYFNTYYNAEEAFKDGQVEHEKLMRNYPDSLLVTPTADIVSKYDRAIEKANKTIETFPKKEKWHDDALFLMGKAYFYKKEMERCIFRFRQLEREFPQSKFIPHANLYIGKAYIEEGNLDKAEEVLLTTEKRYPELNKDHEITMLMVAIAIRRHGKSQAIALLEQLLKTIKSDHAKLDLYLQAAELYIELKQYPKAIILLKDAPRKKDFPVQLFRIDRALFVCYKEIDSLSLAMKQIDAMVTNKSYSPFLDEMLYQKGLLHYAMGDVEGAIKVLKKLTVGVDSNSVYADTSSFKAKALVELARMYQKEHEDYGKAYNLFKLASSTQDTVSQNTARKFLSAMDRLKKLRDGTENVDSTVAGSSTFAVGELFRFELNEPDSAYNEFIQLATDSSADARFIPKALLQAAFLARDNLKNKKLGDSLFTIVLSTYPSTEFAKSAQFELGEKVSIATRLDSAETMYRKAEQLFYKENKVKEAIKLFYETAKVYPEVAIAPKSLFAAAWISNTVLFKNKTSKMLYEKICKNYPESIYCTDIAKPRIKVVVDTLEALNQIRRTNSNSADIGNQTGRSGSGNSRGPASPQPDSVFQKTTQNAPQTGDSDNDDIDADNDEFDDD